MPHPPSPNGGRPSRSVAIRFRAGRAPEPSEQAEDTLSPSERVFWEEFKQQFGPARLHPVHHGGESGGAGRLLKRVRERKAEFKPRIDVNAQFTVDLEQQDRLEDATHRLRRWDALEHATVRGFVSVPVGGAEEPTFADQTHLHQAPAGVAAEAAWARVGGTGAGVQFADVEGGWDTAHSDLSKLPTAVVFGSAAERTDRSDEDAEALIEHGTAVIGLVAASHDGVRCAGVVPDLRAVYFSAFRRRASRKDVVSWVDVTSDAVVEAILNLQDGDVLLIEAQDRVTLDATGQAIYRLPIEVRPEIFWAIEAATILGIAVVEPAGNGFNNLDRFLDENNVAIFDRAQADSGAIFVGASYWNAGTAAQDGCGMNNVGSWGTNYGARVDCFAPGYGVVTSSAVSANGVRHDFAGTSAASAIIAGTCAAIQGALVAAGRDPLPPKDLRALLSEPALGTSPSAGWVGLIGVMPDLAKALAKLGV